MQKIKAKFLNLKTSIYSKFIRLQNPEIFKSDNDDEKNIEVILENTAIDIADDPVIETADEQIEEETVSKLDENSVDVKKNNPIPKKKSSKPPTKKPIAKKNV
jgi:hypothetical protein